MIHQPSGGYHGQATDVEIHAREILSLRDRYTTLYYAHPPNSLNRLYVKHTGRTVAEVEKSVERDTFMSAEEAVTYGLIDSVMEKRA